MLRSLVPEMRRGAQTTYKARKPVVRHSDELPPEAVTDAVLEGESRPFSVGRGRLKARVELGRK